MNIVEYLENRSKLWIFSLGLIGTLFIGLIDYKTGYEIGLSVFYLAPIAFVVWIVNREAGVFLSIISTVIMTYSDFLSGKTFQNYFVETWETTLHLAFFIIVTFVLSKLKSEFKERKKLILELEVRVKERTKDLVDINKDLEKEITERRRAEEHITESLREKETLLRELYHRTRNNMQVIYNLINLQALSINDKKIVELFKETQNRIKSMALVHEKLYQSKDLSNINLKDYINELANTLLTSYQLSRDNIVLKLDIDNISVSIDAAIPSGLIVNELMSNSLKYAFPGDRQGEISIILHKTEKGGIQLYFSDNGIGFPKGFDINNPKSLGLKLVKNLTEKQLEGKVELRTNQRTEFLIKFKEPHYLKRI